MLSATRGGYSARHYFADGDIGYDDTTVPPDEDEFLAGLREADEADRASGPPLPGAVAPAVPVAGAPDSASPPDGFAPNPYFVDTDDPGAPGQSPLYPGAEPPPPPASYLDKALQRSIGDADALRSQMLSMPVRGNPKWWQRVGAGALGGIAGWSNAASRTKNPIDISHATENILYPGYEAKLAQWRDRVVPLEKAAELSGQQAGMAMQSQKLNTEAHLKNAQATAAMQHGQYWLSRSQQERNQWKIDPKTGDLYNTISGSRVSKAQTPNDRQQIAAALIPAGVANRDTLIAEYALNGKLTVPTRAAGTASVNATLLGMRAAGATTGNTEVDAMSPQAAGKAIELGKDRAPRDPLVDVMRQDQLDRHKREDADKTNTWKVNEEQKVHAWRQSMLNSLNSSGHTGGDTTAETQRINKEASSALQNIQNEYARRGRATGGIMQDFDVSVDPSGNFRYAPRQSAPAAAATSPSPQQAPPPPQQRATPATPKPAIAVGQPVMVDGRAAVVTGINPKTGKPIVRYQ